MTSVVKSAIRSPRSVLGAVCVAIVLSSLHPLASARQQQPETARIDQLISECRQLLGKGIFDGISKKAEEAAALSQKIGDKIRQSRSLTYVALGAFHSGHTEEAIEPFKQAAELAREGGDRKLQLLALNSAGTLLGEAGRAEEALYFYDQALSLSREQKDRRGEATVLRNIGRVRITVRDYKKADELLQTSLEISRGLNDPALEHAVLVILASLENARANYERALGYQKLALNLETAATPAFAKYQLRNDVAITYSELGKLDKAVEVQLEALDLAKSQKVLTAEATALHNLSNLQLMQGKNAESLVSSTRALSLIRRTGGDPTQQANILYIEARAQRALGETQDALANLRLAMTQLERARVLFVPTESARAEFVSRNGFIFTEAIDLLLNLGRQREALAVAESYHGRAFLDRLVESRADLARVLPRELLDKEDEILGRISSVQREIWQQDVSKQREQELKKELAAAENALEEFQLRVRHSNPRYASLKNIAPLTADRIEREVIDPGTALVEYVVGEEKSFAWLVSNNSVSYAELPAEKEIKRLVGAYTGVLSERAPGPGATQAIISIKSQSRALYKCLLEPFEKDLLSARRLLVVPDGPLAYLPFETLVRPRETGSRGGGEYLIERVAVAYAPSASALEAVRTMQGRTAGRGLIAFGDPVYPDAGTQSNHDSGSKLGYYAERGVDLRSLPYTRREVTRIGALFPPAQRELLLGADANEQKAKAEKLDEFRYVHFAAHGVVDEENPARSGIVLSLDGPGKEDGVLQVIEIMRLKLDADLVTLSACRTGLGKVISGEGVLGLTRAFLYAGTPSVVASLWNVNDTATAELMAAFYKKLREGLSKGEALRQAKLQMLHGSQAAWRHPYYWASFVLVGAAD